ncbi:MAG: hypothetical protein OXU20_01425 [Myxococcales bacterium]|nr:hypothetical protein [Myxococcales bacterium]MDD9969730.1 hypothetical protein [Myxococcales bacterium]
MDKKKEATPSGSEAGERKSDTQAPRRGRSRRWWLWTGLPLLAVVGAFAGRAWAHGSFGCRGRHHSRSPDEFSEHLSRVVERVLSRLDVSDAQLMSARAIVARNASALYGVHQEGRDLRRQLIEAVKRDDRNQIEVLRKRAIETVDQGSSLWIANVQELSDVLTADQRAKLVERLERFGGRWGHGGGHWSGEARGHGDPDGNR